MFGDKESVAVSVRKIALTRDQVEQYNPPPNPAKRSDSRFQAYSEKHGVESWEVDALPPNVLAQLIREAFDGVCDTDLMDEVKEQEEADKARLREAVEKLMRNGTG